MIGTEIARMINPDVTEEISISLLSQQSGQVSRA